MTLEEENEIFYAGVKKYSLYIAFAGVIVGLFCYYGLDDDDGKRARLFETGDGVNAEYKIRLGGDYYHLGEMVSHLANIALLSVIGILIVWILHTGIEGYLLERSNKKQ